MKILVAASYYLIFTLILVSYGRVVLTNPGRVPKYDLRSSNNGFYITEQLGKNKNTSLNN